MQIGSALTQMQTLANPDLKVVFNSKVLMFLDSLLLNDCDCFLLFIIIYKVFRYCNL